MGHKLVWAALVAAFAVACGNGGKQQVRAVDGEISVEPALVDFGDLALGKQDSRSVVLRNDGIVSVGLAALQVPKDFQLEGIPESLGPGAEVKVKVTYQPSALGKAEARVPLTAALSDQGAVPLTLRGRAVLGLAQLSGDVLDFGPVVQGRTSSLMLALTNNDGKARTEVQVPARATGDDAGAFAVAPGGTLQLDSEQVVYVQVSFTPGHLGDFAAELPVVPCPTCQARTVKLVGQGVEQLLKLEPESMDFGYVELGKTPQQAFSVTNISKQPVVLQAFQGAGPGFSPVLDGGLKAPVTLQPGQRITGSVTFAPRVFGSAVGATDLTASLGASPKLAYKGNGVGAALVVKPSPIDVGAAIPDTTRTRYVQLNSTGVDPQGAYPLTVKSISLKDPQDFVLHAPAAPFTIGAPGSKTQISVDFSPRAGGRQNATLVIESSDSLQPVQEIPVTALGRILAPCNAQILPSSTVEFGLVGIFRPSTQGFELVNQGEQDCIFGDPELQAAEGFSWPGGAPPAGRTIPPGSRMSVRVQFVPQAAKEYTGRVRLYLSNPGQPTLTVDLHGTGDASCLLINPASMDFGGAQVGCYATAQVATVKNNCSGAVTITDAQVSPGPFVLGPACQGSQCFSFPLTLQPQQTGAVTVRYQPKTIGDDVASLAFYTSLRADPYRVGLTGAGQPGKKVHDEWDQGSPKVDLLIVLDNSGSMAEEQKALADNVDVLFDRIKLANADFHIAFTTTGMSPYTAGWSQCPGGANGGEAGRFFPVDNSHPRMLTPATPGLRDAFIQNTQVGLCHWDERVLEPMVAAVTDPLAHATKAPGSPWPADGNAGFLRDDARLAFLAITDSDDGADEVSPPPIPDLVAQIVAAKKGAKDLISFAGLVTLSNCPNAEMMSNRNLQIAKALNDGKLWDLCDLGNMSNMLRDAIGTLMLPLTSFPLSATPQDPTQIVVTVNGAVSTNWTYDPRSNRIVFPNDAVPVPGSHITADYTSACN